MSGVLEASHAMMSATLGETNASEVMNALRLAIRGTYYAPTSAMTQPLGQAVFNTARKYIEIETSPVPCGPVWDDHRD